MGIIIPYPDQFNRIYIGTNPRVLTILILLAINGYRYAQVRIRPTFFTNFLGKGICWVTLLLRMPSC